MRRTVRVFLAPHLHFVLLGTLNTPLAHLPVILYLGFGKVSVFPEYDVEAQARYAEGYQYQSGYEDLHLVDEA